MLSSEVCSKCNYGVMANANGRVWSYGHYFWWCDLKEGEIGLLDVAPDKCPFELEHEMETRDQYGNERCDRIKKLSHEGS